MVYCWNRNGAVLLEVPERGNLAGKHISCSRLLEAITLAWGPKEPFHAVVNGDNDSPVETTTSQPFARRYMCNIHFAVSEPAGPEQTG